MNYLLGYEQYINHDIFTIEYPLGKDNPEYASGKIIKIIDKIFEHSLDTDYGSSGCPIISCGNLKVLGIHRGACKNSDNNIGAFFGQIINFPKIQNKFKRKILNKHYLTTPYLTKKRIRKSNNDILIFIEEINDR